MNDDFLKVAKQAAIEAGKVIMKYHGDDHKLLIKTDNSDFATKADLEAEKIIVEIIKKNFPSHNIIAEEKTRITNDSSYKWVIDPIDGTVSYAYQIPFFTVSIGLLKDNEPIVGVIYHVDRRDLYWAQKGKGAFLNGKRIQVSKTGKLKDGVAALGIGSIGRRKEKLNNYFYPLLEKVRYVYMWSGGAYAMALLAKGSLDIVASTAWVWDHAAGGIIIAEAGGKVTDKQGDPVDWSLERSDFVASNGLIHDELLEVLK